MGLTPRYTPYQKKKSVTPHYPRRDCKYSAVRDSRGHDGYCRTSDNDGCLTLDRDNTLSIISYESMRDLKLASPVEIKHVDAYLLNVASDDYCLLGKLTPYIDSSGKTYPLDSWNEIVRRTNLYMKTCVKGKALKTFFLEATQKPACIPSGMHIFSVPLEVTDYLIRDALQDVHDIYWSPTHRSNKKIHLIKLAPAPACNMLFYPGCGHKNPKIRDVFQELFAVAPALARYALIYLSVIRDILRLDNDDMQSVNLCVNHYDPNAAISAHVDTVFTFNDTLGPIFTVAMGQCDKMMDMLPVLLPDSYKPVRIFSKPNEMMMLDGESRAIWAHSTPWNYPHEQYTLVFKCPEFRTKTHDTRFEYDGNSLVIPYHYVSSFESKSDPLS